MSLKDTITQDMKTCMKEKNQIGLSVIRMLRAEIKNTEIDTKTELDDAAVQKLVASAIKKRKEAAAQFKDAGRDDLFDKEMAEADFLMQYMPEQLSDEDVVRLVTEALADVDMSDQKFFGQAMQKAMAAVNGQADGKLVNKVVRDLFNGNN